MISGRFGDTGELFFDIEVITAEGEILPVEVLLDTGFTRGWLAMDTQDVESLGWSLIMRRYAMKTARGEELFDIYSGNVIIDGEEFTVPVVAGIAMPDNLLGLQWLQTRRLVVDFPSGLLTLGSS
ncbi:MAG: aspartyl protease [Symploca sp. SIO3E6]|nr:aspartyl protease [Caldora sp. SIO3E6]